MSAALTLTLTPNTALTQKYKTTTKQTNKIEIGKYRNGGFVFQRAENESLKLSTGKR